MYEKLDACPLCEHSRFRNHLITTDFLVSNESFALSKCENCELVFTNPRPTEAEIAGYYQSEEYISHSNQGNTVVNTIYRFARTFTLRHKVNLVKKINNPQSLLDIGCGTGHFINVCLRQGIQVSGVEPDTGARDLAMANGLTVHRALEELNDPQQYDMVTMWHVLEHVHDLKGTLNHISKILKPKNGRLLIAVPNLKSWDAQYYKEYWAGYDVPRHLYHFSPQTLERLLSQNGYKKVDVYPQKLDAYYVSMLSEKYQKTSNIYFKALKSGMMSNNKAKKDNMYSSLIHVFKR